MLTFQDRANLKKSIENFRCKNHKSNKKEIVSHFVKQGYARRTIYNNIDRLDRPQKQTKKIGRPSKLSVARRKSLKRLVKHRVGASCRKAALKYNVAPSTIHYNLKKMGLSYRKRQKVPKNTDQQLINSKKRCRSLVNFLYATKSAVVIDDEKYFTFSCDDLPGNSGFYTDNIEECPDEVRFKKQEKFPTKILVWIAMSEKGVSEPLIRPSKSGAINQQVYLSECLQKRLLPFISKHHKDGNYLFWPDLAKAHYAKSCVQWMCENIEFLPEEMNPANVPQARPIETFWGDLVQRVYNDGWEAKNEEHLVKRIKQCLKQFDQSDLQAHMKSVKTKLRGIADSGVLSSFKKLNINNK